MQLIDLRGISEKREKDLNKLNIFTPEDLVRYFPRAYLDLTQQQKISSCYHNDVALVACRVASPPQVVYAGKRPFVKVWCDQEGERFSAIWFNALYVRQHLHAGEEYLFYGRVSNRWGTGTPSMVNPSFEPRERNVRLKGIVPVYGLKGSLTQRAVREAVREALRYAAPSSAIPPSLARRYALQPLAEAYRRIHAPAAQEEIAAASARIAQEGERFSAIWFNALYVRQHLHAGEEYLFYGRVSNRWGTGTPSMVNPSFEPRERNVRLKGIVPVYGLKGSLTQRAVREAVREALRYAAPSSAIPPSLARRYALQPLAEAYRRIHAPAAQEEIAAASARIALEEYFLLITAFRCIKGGKEEARAFRYTCTAADMEAFMARFPFSFTEGQKKAVAEIMADCSGPHRMNRLLQGDVGCGKTAVALCGVYLAVKSGFQAAMIAPTEVLAAQNCELARRYLPEYRIAFLAGSTPAKEKREIKRALAAGELDVVCGTHAVLQEDVQPRALAFCVCDEQHRFGVAQRSALSEKGAGADMLVMSATPIPRTLSLIFYGDLDISEIRDKPRARAEIVTAVIPRQKYDDMLAYIADEAQKGNQSYFVCPKIEGDEEGSLMSVTELFDELRARLPRVRFALLHGRMKEKDKAQVMADFKAKKI